MSTSARSGGSRQSVTSPTGLPTWERWCSITPLCDGGSGVFALDVLAPFELRDGNVFAGGHFHEPVKGSGRSVPPCTAAGARRGRQPGHRARLEPRLERQKVAHRIALDDAAQTTDPLRLAIVATADDREAGLAASCRIADRMRAFDRFVELVAAVYNEEIAFGSVLLRARFELMCSVRTAPFTR